MPGHQHSPGTERRGVQPAEDAPLAAVAEHIQGEYMLPTRAAARTICSVSFSDQRPSLARWAICSWRPAPERRLPRPGELGVGGSPMIGNWLRLATLPDASAYHSRVALRELSRHEILQAVAEYDRLGQDRFLEKYGFGTARSYRPVVDGKTYDSKAIVGAAHGFLPGQGPLAAADFSGGAATVGRLLSGLGFQMMQAGSGLTAGKLVELLSALRLYRSPAGRQALYQPLALLWAIGRAHQGLARMAEWSETVTALGKFLERHGEHPRPHYPVAALYHAGLWDLGGPQPPPPAHGNAPLRWSARNQPASGLPAAVYNLVRYSGEARVAAVAAIVDKYLLDADYDAILADAGLADSDIADDEVPASGVILARSPLEEEYRRLCGIGAGAADRSTRLGRPRVSVDILRLESTRRAVLLRSEGHCESPCCTGEPQDITDAGHPILEVDHIQDLAKGGPDYPEQMIALCPNCHAIKTRGRNRERLRHQLFTVARQRHEAILSR
jgi:5-methylcytosine-specific restriction protein A